MAYTIAAPNAGKELGICVLCEQGAPCAHTKDPKRPVLQCDELIGHEYSVTPTRSGIALPATDPIFRFSPKRLQIMQRIF
jgi:hypothetical protein